MRRIFTNSLTLRVLSGRDELIEYFRLRYRVYKSLNYIQYENDAELEIDEFDPYSIPLGVISDRTGELVALLRIVTDEVQSFYSDEIKRIVSLNNVGTLKERVATKPQQPFPTLASYNIDGCNLLETLERFNSKRERVFELSRTIVLPGYRGYGLSRSLVEYGSAYALQNGMHIGIGACTSENVPMYARYGYSIFPGVSINFNEKVRQMSFPLIANLSNVDALPEPTNIHVREMLQELSRGSHEFILSCNESLEAA